MTGVRALFTRCEQKKREKGVEEEKGRPGVGGVGVTHSTEEFTANP